MNEDKLNLFNQNEQLKNKAIELEKTIMGERMEYQRVINEITNNCEKVIKNEKLLNMKTEYLQK